MHWLQQNWPFVALAVSELLPFVPGKANGIAQAVFKIASAFFGRKQPADGVK